MSGLNFFNKKEEVKRNLSRKFLILEAGARIETVDQYARSFSVARGTVQQALSELEGEGALSFQKRGTLGTYIENISHKKLWPLSGWEMVTGANALPFTQRLAGLTTGIYENLEQRQVPFYFVYMQGAENRVKGLLTGKYDFALLSEGAAMEVLKHQKELQVSLTFGPQSFLSGYALVSKTKRDWQSFQKIGRDPASPDHVTLIQALWQGRDVSFVDMQYTHMPTAIRDGEIDGTIFNMDSRSYWQMDSDLCFEDIPPHLAHLAKTGAVLLTAKDNYGIEDLLKANLDSALVGRIQKEVVVGERTPVY